MMPDVARDERSRDRHTRPTVGLRLPADLADWLRGYAEATGQKQHALIVQAVEELRTRIEIKDSGDEE
jgi:predicted transcriptional regulator